MADPALGLSLKLKVDDSALAADVTRARAKVTAIGAAGGDAPLPMPEGTESYGQMLERKRVELIKAERAKNEEIRAEQERINELLAQDVEEHEARVARQRRKAREQQIAEERAAAAQRAEASAMRSIGLETGGATPGRVNQLTAAYARMDDSLKGVRKRFTETAKEAVGWLGVAGMIAGTATTFYAIGEAITNGVTKALQSGTERANEFKASLDLSDVEGSLKAYGDNLAELDAAMAERSAGSVRGWFSSIFQSDASLQEEILKKRKDRDGLAEVAKAARDRAQREKEKAERVAKEKETAEAERRARAEQRKKEAEDGKRFADEAFQTEQDNLKGSLSERDQIMVEAAAKKRELEKRFNELGAKEAAANEDAYYRARSAIDVDRDRRLREFDEQQLKSAQRVQQAWTNAFRSIREENNKAFATDSASSMVQFAQQLRIEGMAAQANMNRIVVEGVQ